MVSPPHIRHRQQESYLPTGKAVWVDTGLAPLLRKLWQNGYRTVYSCQGFYTQDERYRHFNVFAYIMFSGEHSAEEFRDSAIPWVGLTVQDEVCRDGYSAARFHAGDVEVLGRLWKP